MLRAIKIPGNKIFTGETIDDCFKSVKEAGVTPPMTSIAGWINEEGTFVNEKPSETIADMTINAKVERLRTSINPMMTQTLETPAFNDSYFIKHKKSLKYWWNRLMNFKVKL